MKSKNFDSVTGARLALILSATAFMLQFPASSNAEVLTGNPATVQADVTVNDYNSTTPSADSLNNTVTDGGTIGAALPNGTATAQYSLAPTSKIVSSVTYSDTAGQSLSRIALDYYFSVVSNVVVTPQSLVNINISSLISANSSVINSMVGANSYSYGFVGLFDTQNPSTGLLYHDITAQVFNDNDGVVSGANPTSFDQFFQDNNVEISPNTIYNIQLYAESFAQGGAATVIVDPYIEIASLFANDYHLDFSEGIGNAPVPEPTTMLLFATGLAGLAATGRRKRN